MYDGCFTGTCDKETKSVKGMNEKPRYEWVSGIRYISRIFPLRLRSRALELHDAVCPVPLHPPGN